MWRSWDYAKLTGFYNEGCGVCVAAVSESSHSDIVPRVRFKWSVAIQSSVSVRRDLLAGGVVADDELHRFHVAVIDDVFCYNRQKIENLWSSSCLLTIVLLFIIFKWWSVALKLSFFVVQHVGIMFLHGLMRWSKVSSWFIMLKWSHDTNHNLLTKRIPHRFGSLIGYDEVFLHCFLPGRSVGPHSVLHIVAGTTRIHVPLFRHHNGVVLNVAIVRREERKQNSSGGSRSSGFIRIQSYGLDVLFFRLRRNCKCVQEYYVSSSFDCT